MTLWLPFVAANTVFTVCNNLFLKLHILTDDPRILDLPGNQVTDPVTLKDIVGRTVHWCVFDGGTQLGGALWFIQALFQISILYALVEFVLRKGLHLQDTLTAQGFVRRAAAVGLALVLHRLERLGAGHCSQRLQSFLSGHPGPPHGAARPQPRRASADSCAGLGGAAGHAALRVGGACRQPIPPLAVPAAGQRRGLGAGL